MRARHQGVGAGGAGRSWLADTLQRSVETRPFSSTITATRRFGQKFPSANSFSIDFRVASARSFFSRAFSLEFFKLCVVAFIPYWFSTVIARLVIQVRQLFDVFLSEELVCFSDLSDHLLWCVRRLFIVRSSFPNLGHRTRTTGDHFMGTGHDRPRETLDS